MKEARLAGFRSRHAIRRGPTRFSCDLSRVMGRIRESEAVADLRISPHQKLYGALTSIWSTSTEKINDSNFVTRQQLSNMVNGCQKANSYGAGWLLYRSVLVSLTLIPGQFEGNVFIRFSMGVSV